MGGISAAFLGFLHPEYYTELHVALMGTITARPCKSGALRHTAQIRLKRNGCVIHSEARTFATITRAREWVRSREYELRHQLATQSTVGPRTRKESGSHKSAHRGNFNPIAHRTLFLLLLEFGSGQIPLEKCGHYFGMGLEEAKRAATRQALPIPAFRLGSQKSPWMISAYQLAQHIDKTHAESEREWKMVRSN